MLALRKVSPGRGGLEVSRIPEPALPGPGEVLLRVRAAGICGTDLHIFEGRGLARRMALPTVLGHEMCGVVEAVGTGVTRVAPGQRVSVESHLPCGECYTCHRGWSHVCPRTRYPGIDFDGGFAGWTVLPDRLLWPVPDAISDEAAAMMEPFGIAVHASLEGSGIAGLNLLVAGCGPIGLMTVAAARALGANRIIATDIRPARLAAAGRLGADRVVDVAAEDPAAVVADLTHGNGVDVAIEYSGQQAVLDALPGLVTNGGEIRLLASGETLALGVSALLRKGITVRHLHGRRLFSTWERSTALLRDGRVGLEALVSHRLDLPEALDGFAACQAGEALKVLLTPAAG
jgi:threonine 3-dehydrogenase